MEQKHLQLRVAIVLLSILALLSYVVMRLMITQTPEAPVVATSTPVAPSVEKLAPASTQKGLIQLSLVPRRFDSLPVSYTYTPGRVGPDELAFTVKKNSGFFPAHLSRSPNGLWSTFIGIVPPTKGGTDSSLVLYRAPYVDDAPLADVIHEGQMMVNFSEQERVLAPRLPQINDKGVVLYMALHDKSSQSKVGDFDLLDWDIHVHNGKKDVVVATGIYPRWIDNDTFVYIAKDGVHRHSVAGNADVLAFALTRANGTPLKIQANMMPAVSPDRKTFVLSNPEESGVYVYSLAQDGAHFARFIKGAWGFWPLISPDGKTLAIQSVNGASGEEPRPYIAFFDLSTGEPLPEAVTLADYRPDSLFMTDWK